MKRFHGYDEKYNRYVATLEPTKHCRKHVWAVLWSSGRAPEYFQLLSDAKAFVERLYHGRKIEWHVTIK